MIILALAIPVLAPASAASESRKEPIRAVTTFPIIETWVKFIGGDQVQVYSLVSENSSVHTFTPLPGDLRKLSKADLTCEIGLGLEFWFDDLHRASRSKALRVILSEGQPRLSWAPSTDHNHEGHAHDGKEDPHLWMNPDTASSMVATITKTMVHLRPGQSRAFYARLDSWIQTTREADIEAKKLIRKIPGSKRKILTLHHNLAYWCGHYGFTLSGSVLNSLSSEHEDPSAGRLARLIQKIRRENIAALVFADKENPDLLQQVAKETGIPLVGPFAIESLPPVSGSTKEGNRYAELLQWNARLITQALAPPPES